MKLAFCLLLLCVTVSAKTHSQARLSIEVKNANLVDVFDEITRKTGYEFIYSNSELRGLSRVNVSFTDADIKDVLSKSLENTGLWYVIDDRLVVISPKLQAPQPAVQRTWISGTVRDAKGNPMAGVTVTVKDVAGLGVSTDAAGKFRINVPNAPKAVLQFSCVGMKNRDVVIGNRTELDVTMEMAELAIDQVVVTGMGNRPKEGYTGSQTTLRGDDIRKISPTNILGALAQIDPGFKMQTSNVAGSNPNAVPEYNLRGQAGMGSYQSDDVVVLRGDLATRPNQPLFVLDGMIGVSVTTIMDLDPSQVESMTLLKDAAATVIYGSQAANGVIVIETKPPSEGKLRFSYNGNFGLSIPDLSVYDLLDAEEKLRLEEMAGYYFGMENEPEHWNYYNRIKQEILSGVDTYWIKEPVRVALAQRHLFTLEGGDRTLVYKITLGAGFAPGVMKATNLDTKTGRVELRYRTDKLMISNVVTVDHNSGTRLSPYGSFQEYAMMNPYLRPRDENGNINLVLQNPFYTDKNGDLMSVGFHGGVILNPLYNTLYNQKDYSRELQLREHLVMEYRPLDNLRLFMDFAVTGTNGLVEVFKSAQHTSFYNENDPQVKGSFDWTQSELWDYNLQLGASYNKSMGDHTLLADLRYSMKDSQTKSTTIIHKGFPNDRLSEVQMGSTHVSTGGFENTARSLGIMLSANYIYKHRYAADFSMRVDASSEFGQNNRYAPFWSGGLRWNLDRERFIEKLKFFDELVLRATYGVTGSQGFEPYLTQQVYTYAGLTNLYKGFPVVGAEIYRIGNPNLKWQQTDKMNLALDMTILRNLFSFRFEYYENYTQNTLLNYTLAPSVGFSTIKENLGKVSNKGYEITFRAMPYTNAAKQSYWNIRVSGARNKSCIEQISNALKVQNEANAKTQGDRPLPRYENGMPQTLIWAVRSAGIDPQSGREVFIKRNGNLTFDYDPIDLVPVGDKEPELAGSLSTDFTYKGFTIALNSQFSWGGQFFNQTLLDKIENPDPMMNTDRRVLTERWQKPGDQVYFSGLNPYPHIPNSPRTKASSRFVMNSNEWALTSVNLSYRMDESNSKFIKHTGLSSATVALYMQDIGRLSTIKMERGIDYPFARQISMSLNIIF